MKKKSRKSKMTGCLHILPSLENKNNNVKIDYQYDKVTELNELGFAGIKKDGKWGVIDKEGNIILEPTYTIPEQNGEPYFIGKYYKVISGYEEEYFTDDINE